MRGVVWVYGLGCALFIGAVVYAPELFNGRADEASVVSMERVHLQDPLPPPELLPAVSLNEAQAEAEQITEEYARDCRRSYQGEGSLDEFVERCVDEKFGF